MPTDDRLSSWKEIAEYLGRDVRTALRWEHVRGLPVHRIPGGRRGAVFGYRTEIEAWLRRQAAPDRGDLSVPLEHVGPSTGAPGHPAMGVTAAKSRGGSHRFAWRTILLVAVCLGAGGALVGRVRLASREPRTAPRISKVDFEARAIVARGEDGSVLWSHGLQSRVDLELLADPLASRFARRYAIVDLDGDGHPDVVVTVPLRADRDDSPLVDELLCLSANGRLLWSTRLEDRIVFRGGSFGPPWHDGHVAVYWAGGRARIVWSQDHNEWWPCVVTVLDEHGKRLRTLVHPGLIRALGVEEIAGRSVVLLGGINNSVRAAFFAAIDAEAMEGGSPTPPGSPYESVGRPVAPFRRYAVFPPSDISTASAAPYNCTRDILRKGDSLSVHTQEADRGAPAAELIFTFSLEFELLDARSSDSWPAHNALQKAGQLDHPASLCPWYRWPPPARAWSAGSGWQDLPPRPTVGVLTPSAVR